MSLRSKANPDLPDDFIVVGLVFNVAICRINTVVPIAMLRAETPKRAYVNMNERPLLGLPP